jgi:hypothetical protein
MRYLLALTCLACLPPNPELAPLSQSESALASDDVPLYDKVRAYEERYYDVHAPSGLAHETEWQDGQIVRRHGISDCAIWTGSFLAGTAARYALYRDAASLDSVRRTLDGVHRLHAITGVPGLWARCAWRPDELVEEPEVDLSHVYDGTGAHAGWRFNADLSQDQVSGLIFGLGLAYDLVDDAAVRATIRDDMRAVAHHLIDNDLRFIDVDGQPTRFGDLNPPTTTLFGLGIGGFHAVMALGLFQVAAHVTGDADLQAFLENELIGRRRFHEIVRDQLHIEVPDALAIFDAGVECDTNYFNYNMMFLSIFNLIRLEEDSERRQLYQAAMRDRLWDDPGAPPVLSGFPLPGEPNNRQVRTQANPFWTYLYAAVGPEQPTAAELFAAKETLRQYWQAPASGGFEIDNSATHPEQCRDRYDQPMHKDAPVPLAQRAPWSFAFAANPYGVRQAAAPWEYAAVDYQTTYWLGRWLGLVRYPDSDGDQLADDVESGRGTDPTNWDSDGDGLADGEDPAPLIPEAAPEPDSGPAAGDEDQPLSGGDTDSVAPRPPPEKPQPRGCGAAASPWAGLLAGLSARWRAGRRGARAAGAGRPRA